MAAETGRDLIAVAVAVIVACLLANWMGLGEPPMSRPDLHATGGRP